MGTRLATAVALVTCVGATGCPSDEGVVITLTAAPAVATSVTSLELFLGGPPEPDAGGRRYRDALGGTGDGELFTVETELDGSTLFIHGPWDQDVMIAAIAGYRQPPDTPVAFPFALAIVDPLVFTPGKITTAEARLMVLPRNGAMNRYAVRTRGPPVATQDGMLTHSCLDWEVDDSGARDAIVRVDDYDCDGTLPNASSCSDPTQDFFGVPDDLPDADADGDTARTCERCTVNAVELPCECDDGNPDVHAFATEVCNGIDDDCDDRTYYVTPIDGAPPCINDDGSGGCEVGLAACDERLSDDEENSCKSAITVDMNPCQLSIDSCIDLTACSIDNPAGAREELFQCRMGSDPLGAACLGDVPLSELIEGLDDVPGSPPQPSVCDVAVWQPVADGLWHVSLVDPNTPATPPVQVMVDQPCDRVLVHVDLAPGSSTTAYYAVVSVIETSTGTRMTVPLSFSVDAMACATPPLQCLPPT